MARTNRTNDANARIGRSNPSDYPKAPYRPGVSFLDSPHLDRLAWMQRLARSSAPPPVLKSYVLGAQRIAMLHVAAEDKAEFDLRRARLRAALGFPVTQPGAFALLLEAAEGEDLAGIARRRMQAAS